MPTLTPFLWFDDQAEQAAQFYSSIFKDSKTSSVMRHGEKVLGVTVRLLGQDLTLFNGGPMFKFTPAMPLFVSCKTQEEVDDYWGRLKEGGEEQPCGWVKDKYGLNWQIVPTILGELLGDPDALKAGRVMQAMLRMKKIDIQVLLKAADGEPA